MSAKPDALYRIQLDEVYREDRRRIVGMLAKGEIGPDDARRLAGENVFLCSNGVTVEDDQFKSYKRMLTEAQVNAMLRGTGVKVEIAGGGVVLSTPNGRAYYDGKGKLGKIDGKLDGYK